MRTGERTRRALAGLVVTAAAALLVGCTSSPVGAAAPRSSQPTAAPTSTAVSQTTPPPTQTAADATPLRKRCAKLVPAAVAAGLLPDLALERGWEPDAGSPAARLAALGGTACRWTDSAGDVLEVAAAKPSVKDATALKNDLVRRSQSVPTYGGEAYFQVTDHVGEADVFRGRTWLLTRSNRYFEPGDAIAVVQSALTALGHAPIPSPAPTAPTPGATATPEPGAEPTVATN